MNHKQQFSTHNMVYKFRCFVIERSQSVLSVHRGIKGDSNPHFKLCFCDELCTMNIDLQMK